MKNYIQSIFAASILLGLCACQKTTTVPYFRYTLPSEAQINQCDPTRGGSQSLCASLDPQTRLGVAVVHGIGLNGSCKISTGAIGGGSNSCDYYVKVQGLGFPSGTGCIDSILTDDSVIGGACSNANDYESCEQAHASQLLDQAFNANDCLFH